MNKIPNPYKFDQDIIRFLNRNNSFFKKGNVCNAPSRTMRFSLTGNVLACCFNRYFKLGKYPENSIHEIWFGDKKSFLNKSVQTIDFSNGCQVCENNILNKNFNAVGAIQYDYLPDNKKKYPTMLDFEIGNSCNLECIMCNGENSSLIRKNREKKEPYTIPYDSKFVDQLDEFIPYLNETRFVGGEPFLTEIHFQIWEKILKINPAIDISVLTNATVLNDRVKNFIQTGNFNISVSIDSFVKKTYEEIRLNANFDKVWENILFFKNYMSFKKRPFYINVCPIKQNRYEIPSIIEYCNTENINLIFHSVIYPAHCSLWNMNTNEIDETISYYKKYQPTLKTEIQKSNAKYFESLVHQLELWKIKTLQRIEIEKTESSEDLKNKLLEKLKNHLRNNKMDYNKINSIHEQLNKIIKDIHDDSITKKALYTINLIDSDRIIAEFEISNELMLFERFITLGQ